MAFDPALFFVVAHNASGTRRLVVKQSRLAPILLNPAVPAGGWTINAIRFYDNAGTQVAIPGLPTTVFSIVRGASDASGDHGTVDLDLAALAGLTAAQRNSVLDTFIASGYAEIDIQVSGASQQTLSVQIRALKTAGFLMASNVAQRAHYTGVTGANLAVPGSDALGNYSYHVAEGFDATLTPTGTFTTSVTADSNGDLTFPAAGSAPPDAATQTLLVRVTHTTYGVSLLPIDVHVPTDFVLVLDRSGSMGATVTTGLTKWNAATQVSDLFSDLFGDLAPILSAPNGTISSTNQIRLARFYWDGAAQVTFSPTSGFVAASSKPHVPSDSPSGGTPIGVALKQAAAQFTGSKWKRRHVLLLTDGMDNQGTPSLTALSTTDFPAITDATNGVFLHIVSYALSGETPVTNLNTLATNHGGQFHDAAPDTVPLSSDNLRAKFLSILSSVLPVNRSTSALSIPVEEGIERVVFVATKDFAGTLTLSTTGTGGGSTATDNAQAGKGNGLCWTAADRPEPGTWTASSAPSGAQVYGIYDLALKMRCGVEPHGLGSPIKVWVELDFRGEPVSGADVRVGSRLPIESLGAVLTTFVQKGGIAKAFQRGYLTRDLFAAALPSSHTVDRTVAASQDLRSIQRQLLDAAEAARNLEFQYGGAAVTLDEVSPGRYEATVSSTQNENSYNFYFRADGLTPGGYAFGRDHCLSTVLAPAPSIENSAATLVSVAAGGGKVRWIGTVFPKTVTNNPVGPGLAGHYLVFDYVDPKDRAKLPALATIDHLDGTYSTSIELPEGQTIPAIALFPGRPAANEVGKGGVPVKPHVGKVRKVRVTLDRIQVLDDKDGIFTGKGELAFDAVVAPNGNPARSVRTRIPDKGVLKMTSGETRDVGVVIYEGLVEVDATLSITLGGKEFDQFLFFKRQEKLARYHRSLPLKSAKMSPGDEPNDPESLRDWRVWYTVEVE